MLNISKLFYDEIIPFNSSHSQETYALEFRKLLKLKIKDFNFNNITDLNLFRAFCHKSFVHEQKIIDNNEKLEFIGDAVLDLYVSNYLYQKFNNANEGQLSKIRSSLVNEKTLSEIAKKLGIDMFILLGKGEFLEQGYNKPSILADTFEALLGSIFIDKGYDNCTLFLDNIFNDSYFDLQSYYSPQSIESYDAKSKLQEMIMKKYKITPHYKSTEVIINGESLFKVSLWLGDRQVDELNHSSKKKGIQLLAQKILETKKLERMNIC